MKMCPKCKDQRKYLKGFSRDIADRTGQTSKLSPIEILMENGESSCETDIKEEGD